jgi:hypothetical protein
MRAVLRGAVDVAQHLDAVRRAFHVAHQERHRRHARDGDARRGAIDDRRDPAQREPAGLLLGLHVGHGLSRRLDPDRAKQFAGGERRLHDVDEEPGGGNAARAGRPGDLNLRVQREHHGRPVGRRIGVRQAAADRALVSDLNVADLRRRFGEQRALRGEDRRRAQLRMRRHRADDDEAVLFGDAAQLRDAGEIDDHARLREPQPHGRHETVPAGQDARLVPESRQQRQGFSERRGAMVVEGCRDHTLPTSSAPSPTSAAV